MPSELNKANPDSDLVVDQNTLISPARAAKVRDDGAMRPAPYVLRIGRLVHEMTKKGLIVIQADGHEGDAALATTVDAYRGRDDALWQAPDTTALARVSTVSAVMTFEVATTDTSSLATCALCSSFSVIEAAVKVLRTMASSGDQMPDTTVDADSMVCPECGKLPVMLGLVAATGNRLANEERWRMRKLQCTTAVTTPVTPRMRVCHTHAAARRALSSPRRGPICYARLYDWHEYLGAKTTWQYSQELVHADYVPTCSRFFAGCIGSTRHGPDGLLAIGRVVNGATCFDSAVSVDEKDYEIEDSLAKEYLSTLSDLSLPNREALIATYMSFVCRSVLDDFGHTVSADPGQVPNLTRAEALAVRSSDLDAEFSWAISTGWTKQEILQARAELLAVTGPSSELLLEVLAMQALHNDIAAYTPDVASRNKANMIHFMESSGASAGPLAELQDAHRRITQLAEMDGGCSGAIGEALRIANGNACFSWITQRYCLLSNAHAMQAPGEWQVASWWRWVVTMPGTEHPDPDPDQMSPGARQQGLANWVRSCAWRVAPHQPDGHVRDRAYTELNALAGRVGRVEDVAKLGAGTITDTLLGDIWAACLSGGTGMGTGTEHRRLDAVVDQLRTTLRAACENYSCPCTNEACCVTVATNAAILNATMDEACGCAAALPPDERLRHSDYLVGAVSVIMEAAYNSPARAALWPYDPYMHE